MRDEHVDDLIDLYALGALEPHEQVAVEEHLEDCARCGVLLDEAKQLVAMLAWSPDQHDPPPELGDRLMRRVQQLNRADTRPVRRWWERLIPASGGVVPRLAPAFAVALAIVAIVLGVRTAQLQRTVANLATQLQNQQVLIDVLRDPGTRLVTLQAQPSDPQATVRLLLNPDRSAGYAITTSLPTLPADRTYQLWLIAEGENPTSAGVFDVDQRGAATLPIKVDRSLDAFAAAAISVEPEGGSAAPTTDPILVTPL